MQLRQLAALARETSEILDDKSAGLVRPTSRMVEFGNVRGVRNLCLGSVALQQVANLLQALQQVAGALWYAK